MNCRLLVPQVRVGIWQRENLSLGSRAKVVAVLDSVASPEGLTVTDEAPPDQTGLTHLDAHGAARMVDVSGKEHTVRVARARAVIGLTPALRRAVIDGDLPKGEALGVARLAGIQAAKETGRLIPLCHPLGLSAVEIHFSPLGEADIEVRSEVRCVGQTGVEMEAMCAVSVSALCLYDMCKSAHKGIRISGVELTYKSGGRSGTWEREGEA